jgi:2'-5' RNA ligase
VRLFVAAYPPAAVCADFAVAVGALCVGQPRPPGASVRLVPPGQWHLTLAFLGDVPDGRVPRAAQAVDRAVSAARAAAERSPAAPVIRIAGGGTFGTGRFTTLWAGLRGDVPGVSALAATLARELRAAHLPYDGRVLRPHVTVARPGDRISAGQLAGDLAVLDAYSGPVWAVDPVRLMHSRLGPRPSYETVHEAPLTG